ncbi:zinc transporter ZntB [Acidihalobacter prosperus]
MPPASPFVASYRIDSGGHGVELPPADAAPPGNGYVWLHLDRGDPGAREWLSRESGLSPLVVQALLADDPRPRSVPMDHGLLVVARGANLNPGANPEDMVALRIWVEERRIITVRRRRLQSIEDVRIALAAGTGPVTPGAFVAFVLECLVTRLSEVIGDLAEDVDALEESMLAGELRELRASIAAVRREAVSLRRYLVPQREAFNRLFIERLPWLTDDDRLRLREQADRAARSVEDLELLRERAVVVQEELLSRVSEQMNRKMYVLAMVSVVFLPLGFITGLLGVNVGGVPGGQNPHAFWMLSGALAALVGVEVWLFRRAGWF